MVWTYLTEAQEAPPVCSGVISRIDNGKRGRGRSNLIWEKSVKRDLNDWNITKKLALDIR
jgi:hypothetical protein